MYGISISKIPGFSQNNNVKLTFYSANVRNTSNKNNITQDLVSLELP